MEMPNNHGEKKVCCHMCKGCNLFLVLDLGVQPLSDTFLTSEQLNEPEVFYPLRLFSCRDCGLLQIDYFVDPRILYQMDYLYESSATITGVNHYKSMALDICESLAIAPSSLVVDIGSNVGVLLEGFREVGLKVLGVDPCINVAQKAINNGIETIVDFFNIKVAKKIKKNYSEAKIITATNVFAHLHEVDDAVIGMKELLAKDGSIVIEAPYALDLIEKVEYDTIYHQHIAYLSVSPVQQYFKKFDLELFNVKKVSIHGGSLRYYIGHKGQHPINTKQIDEFKDKEKKFALYDESTLLNFASKVYNQKLNLLELLLSIKKNKKKIAIISTPAKGNTLLNFCHIDSSLIDFATEKIQTKVGRYTPGTHIPIYDDKKLLIDRPDYALILAWNFKDEIINNLSEFREQGGKFIIPIPFPEII